MRDPFDHRRKNHSLTELILMCLMAVGIGFVSVSIFTIAERRQSIICQEGCEHGYAPTNQARK